MNSNFFITGLPRSRTAWLANLFTTGCSGQSGTDQFCHHDLLGKVASLDEFKQKMRHCVTATAPAGATVGDSDSGLVWIFPKLRELYPAARWLLVQRSSAEVVESVQKVAGGTQWEQQIRVFTESLDVWLPQYLDMTDLMLKDQRVRRLPYTALDDYESVAAAWRFLCPTTRLSRARFEFLDKLRVEVIPEKVPLSVAASVIEEIRSQSVNQ